MTETCRRTRAAVRLGCAYGFVKSNPSKIPERSATGGEMIPVSERPRASRKRIFARACMERRKSIRGEAAGASAAGSDDSRGIRAATPPPVDAEIKHRFSALAPEREQPRSGQSWGLSGEGETGGEACSEGAAEAGVARGAAVTAARILVTAALLVLQSRS